jgi:hypothetical protein
MMTNSGSGSGPRKFEMGLDEVQNYGVFLGEFSASLTLSEAEEKILKSYELLVLDPNQRGMLLFLRILSCVCYGV